VVNGQRIFCKGGNWVSPELWPELATPEQYDWYLRRAREANFNMLRQWGGSRYEADVFYDRCDELGILVWQDFQVASNAVPLDKLREELIAEANYQIRRLRNHCCLAVWCGCNEDVSSWEYRSMTNPGPHNHRSTCEGDGAFRVDRWKNDPELYDMLLPGLVSQHGLGVPYVRSSPCSVDDSGNMPNSGNCHISCWKYGLFETNGQYERWREHFERVCSFDSEFAMEGPCSERSLRKFLSPVNLWPPNDVWLYHIQAGWRDIPLYDQSLWIAGATFGEIKDLAGYVKYGQALHAEMMRAEFESARRDRPNNGGTMMWMYNDCWPTATWALIDYYRMPKPCYYAARRACAPHLPIVFERGGRIEFFVGNDTLRPAKVSVTYGQERLDGRRVWARRKRFAVPANGTLKFDAADRRSLKLSPGDFLFIDAVVDGVPLDRVTYFPDGWKGIAWPTPAVSVEVVRRERQRGRHRLHLRLTTDAYARFCHLRLKEFDATVLFSDNFFDLCAGQEKTVAVESPRPLAAQDLQVGHWLTAWE
jgi:beta-mannosidase